MNNTFSTFNTTYVTTSGSGVIGATGQPVYLQALFSSAASGQGIALFSGSAAVTMAFTTLASKTYTPMPMSFANGLTYQTSGNPGDADIRLVFFWVPGVRT